MIFIGLTPNFIYSFIPLVVFEPWLGPNWDEKDLILRGAGRPECSRFSIIRSAGFVCATAALALSVDLSPSRSHPLLQRGATRRTLLLRSCAWVLQIGLDPSPFLLFGGSLLDHWNPQVPSCTLTSRTIIFCHPWISHVRIVRYLTRRSWFLLVDTFPLWCKGVFFYNTSFQ